MLIRFCDLIRVMSLIMTQHVTWRLSDNLNTFLQQKLLYS